MKSLVISQIHPLANVAATAKIGENVIIEKDCSVGPDSIIGHGCVLRPGTHIGKNSVIGHLTVFEGETTVGDNVLIHAQCHITKGMKIEDDVFIGPLCVFSNDARMVHRRRDKVPFVMQGPVVKRGSRLGVGVSVAPGVVIAEECFIYPASHLYRDTLPFGVYKGIPARRCGEVPAVERLYV